MGMTWTNSRRQWRTEELGVLQFMRSRRVRHDLGTEQQQHALVFIDTYRVCVVVGILYYGVSLLFSSWLCIKRHHVDRLTTWWEHLPRKLTNATNQGLFVFFFFGSLFSASTSTLLPLTKDKWDQFLIPRSLQFSGRTTHTHTHTRLAWTKTEWNVLNRAMDSSQEVGVWDLTDLPSDVGHKMKWFIDETQNICFTI